MSKSKYAFVKIDNNYVTSTHLIDNSMTRDEIIIYIKSNVSIFFPFFKTILDFVAFRMEWIDYNEDNDFESIHFKFYTKIKSLKDKNNTKHIDKSYEKNIVIDAIQDFVCDLSTDEVFDLFNFSGKSSNCDVSSIQLVKTNNICIK